MEFQALVISLTLGKKLHSHSPKFLGIIVHVAHGLGVQSHFLQVSIKA